jgi:hypothetical protein
MYGPQLRLRSTVSTVAGSTAFTIRDEVENLGSTPAELELLYHFNVGRPFLEQGSSVACPAKTIVPRDPRAAEGIGTYSTYLGPTQGYAEQVYYYEPIGDDKGESIAIPRMRMATWGSALRSMSANCPGSASGNPPSPTATVTSRASNPGRTTPISSSTNASRNASSRSRPAASTPRR